MIKVCTNSYVLKFVGGDSTARLCHYCRKSKKSGMLCVYSNCFHDDVHDNDRTVFVCPACAVRGCKESEDAWKKIKKMAGTIKKKVWTKEGHRGR